MIWPMARRQTLVQLNDELLALLDERASRTGRSRSEIIRSAVERELASDRDSALDEQIVAGYTRIPPAELDPWAQASAKRSVAAEPW
jgi:metal-responsive CopG/Arc/MetJ family transcriptional regulator